MRGVGPMLPVIAAADNVKSKSRKGEERHDTNIGSRELAIMKRPSTTRTGSTLVESNDEAKIKERANETHHQRDLSLITDFDLDRAAKQLKNGEISDLELALFAFWIRASDTNYVMAKALVRELALDQGYNINKVTNQRVRKLLQELHDIRPRCVPTKRPLSESAATFGSFRGQLGNFGTTRRPATTLNRGWPTTVGRTMNIRSDTFNLRNSRYAPTCDSSFQDQTPTSSGSASGGSEVAPSPPKARMELLPPSLRLKRELALRQASRPMMPVGDTTRYPPNTPDRPAPLSVKSRSSQISNSTPIPKMISRSVSTPVRSRIKEDLTPLPEKSAGSTETPLAHHVSAAGRPHRYSGDIFNDTQSKSLGVGNSFTARLNNSGDKRRGVPGKYMQDEFRDGQPLGQYQLDASDIASSYETLSSIAPKGQNRANKGANYDGGVIGDDTFDNLESYMGTEDEDEGSLLESASTNSDEEPQTVYEFAAQSRISRTTTVVAGPVPTPAERHAAVVSRRKYQKRISNTPKLNFHRPLPLRAYESEATMFPTAGAQANLGRNRSKSVTSIINSARAATESMQHPPLPSSSQLGSSIQHTGHASPRRGSSHTKISEQVNQYRGSHSQRSSNGSTLASFPIPPMENPVGQLPMIVSRAATSSQALLPASSQHPAGSPSLEDTYRAITQVNMTAVLQRTRARGEQLRIVDWGNMSSFEQAWRNVNGVLLVTIFGRQDVLLDESDVCYIDCVARELRNAPNDADPMAWVRRMFEDDI